MRKVKHSFHSFKRTACLAVAAAMILSTALTGCGTQEDITSYALEESGQTTDASDKNTIPSDNAGNTGDKTKTGDTTKTDAGTETKPGDNTGDETKPGTETKPSDNTGDETKPGTETKPSDNTGDETKPGTETKPGDNTDDETKPGTETKPSDNTGDETKPGDNTGDETKPSDNTGDETKPGDNTGDETKPGDNTGDETKPGEEEKPEDNNTGSGDKGVSIKLDVSKKNVNPGDEINYIVTISTKEYTGEAELTLKLDDSFKVKEAVSTPIQRGNISGQGTSTVIYKITEFKPDDPDVVLTVKAQAPADLNVDEAKDAVAGIVYDGDKSATASVAVNVKEANPVTGATAAKVTMTQTQGGESVEPGTKVKYKLSVAMSSEIATVDSVKDAKLHIDIPSEFTGVNVTGYKNGSPFAGSFTEGVATADFGEVKFSDTLEMEAEITIPEELTYKEFSFKGYASGADVTSDDQTMILKTTEKIERVSDEPSVYMTWKDLNSTKERKFRTSDVLPVSIVITNKDAKVDMQDVTVTMAVPEGFNVIENLEAQGIVSDKTEFTWHVEKIEKGGNYTIDLGFTPTAGKVSDTFAASATVSYLNYPLDKEAQIKTNELKAVREIPKADALNIKVMHNNTDKDIVVSAGQNVVFGATVTNNGEVDLKNIVLTGKIESGLIYGKSNNKSVVQKDGVITWTIDELKAGKSENMLFGITVPKENPAASYSFFMEGKADDIAEAKSNTIVMKSGSSDVVVEMQQKKSGMKNPTKSEMSVESGETYTYVISVKNEGTAPAKNVTASVAIPGSLTLNQSSLAKGMTYNSSTIKWAIGDLDAGAEKKAEIKVTAPTGVNTNTSSSAKKTTLNASASMSWVDGANKPGASDSNTVVTVVEQKVENKNQNSNNTNNNGTNSNGTRVNNTGLDTTAVSKATGNQMLAYQDADTIRVTAKYTNLQANTHYVGTVGLVNASGAVIKQIGGGDATVRVDFTTNSTSGTIGEFDFTVNGKDYAGKCLYGAVDVTPDNGKKISYSGIGFDQSTVRSATVAGGAGSRASVNASKTAQSSVAVSYTNVQKNQNFRIEAVLIDRSTGKALVKADGKEVKGAVDFKANDVRGQVDIPLTFGADDVKDKDLAVYATLYTADGKVVLAVDQDMNKSKISGSDLAKNSAATGSNASDSGKGDGTREVVKTGQMGPMTVIMIMVGLCAIAGAGYVLYKKKDQLFKR